MSSYGWDDDHEPCTQRDGDGWAECVDPIQCMDPGCDGEFCTCRACNGRGYDQEVW